MLPLAFLQKWIGIKSYLPQVIYFRVFGYRAYPLIKNYLKLNKLSLRAHINYLVRYKSTNIFRIWILSLRRAISTRDVTFDEDTFYDPTLNGKLTELEVIQIQEIIGIIEMDDFPDASYELYEHEYQLNAYAKGVGITYKANIEKPRDTIII